MAHEHDSGGASRPTIAVMSHSALYYSTRRLLSAASARGAHAILLDPVRVLVHAGPDGDYLSDDGKRLPLPDFVIPRVGATLTDWSLYLVSALAQGGAHTLVTAHGIRLASDKLRTHLALSAAGVPTVQTVAVREHWHIEAALEAVGGAPAVIKLPTGTQGVGVMLAPDMASARSMLMTLISLGHTALVQRLVTMERARDLRVLVIGGIAKAACHRYAPDGDFRSNVHRGGHAERAPLSDDVVALSQDAAVAVGLGTCGVDLIEQRDGSLAVLEVNASPGLEGIEGATGLDLAGAMIEATLGLGKNSVGTHGRGVDVVAAKSAQTSRTGTP